MATVENLLGTYQDESRKNDVSPLIEILTASEDWFLSNLKKGTVNDTITQTMTDTLS